MMNRRQFLSSALSGAALSRMGLGAGPGFQEMMQGPALPHFASKAKRIIYLHMAGSPSQLDLFDPKPELEKLHGKPMPESFTAKERFAFIKGVPKVLASPFEFAQHGESGQWISELLPHTAKIADKLTVVRSMTTTQFNHGPAQIFLNSGHHLVGRPSLGSWLSHGMGTENQNLPGFVVMLSGKFGPSGGASCWSNGFLPAQHQGIRLHDGADPVLFLSNASGVSRKTRRRELDALADLNREAAGRHGDPETEARISQYELAYRMQEVVPELADLSSENAETLDPVRRQTRGILLRQQLPLCRPPGRVRRAFRATLRLGLGQPRHRFQ